MSNPLKPTGYDNESIFAEKVHDEVFGPSRRIRGSKGMRVSHTRDGIFLYPKVKAVSPAAAVESSIAIGTLKAIYDNYLVLTDIASGAIVRVAKQYHLRNSILKEETLDGTVWTFTYQTANPNTVNTLAYVARTKTTTTANGGYFEYQRVTKVYSVAIAANAIPADQIAYVPLATAYATAINIKTIAADTGVAVGTLITNLEYGPMRMWAKKIDQTTP